MADVVVTTAGAPEGLLGDDSLTGRLDIANIDLVCRWWLGVKLHKLHTASVFLQRQVFRREGCSGANTASWAMLLFFSHAANVVVLPGKYDSTWGIFGAENENQTAVLPWQLTVTTCSFTARHLTLDIDNASQQSRPPIPKHVSQDVPHGMSLLVDEFQVRHTRLTLRL